MDKKQNQYQPDFVTPPGETLEEILETIGMSQAELARRMGRPLKTINEIIKGKTSITPETALQFELVLDTPANFWINREQRYQESLARTEEREQMEVFIGWLKNFPLNSMIKFGWIDYYQDKTLQLKEVLNFFGTVSPKQWENLWFSPQVDYRKSPVFEADPYATAAWLRKGELIAQNIDCAAYNKINFIEALKSIRKLTNKSPKDFMPQVIKKASDAGVAVVFIPELPKIRTSGATRWVNSKPVIQLSLRYKTNDHLWFTFFHEAGHILYHGKKEVFLEDGSSLNKKEQTADKFAANFLIPLNDYKKFKPSFNGYSHSDVVSFAEKIDIAPGIVVGRLQHDGKLPPSHLNKLKQSLLWDIEE